MPGGIDGNRARPSASRDSRAAVVEAGYDAMADRFAAWSSRVEGDPKNRFLDEAIAGLPDGARVLDLGCGAGVPSTRRLAERFQVVGVDISAEQLRRARAAVPGATFRHADLMQVELAPESFDAVTSFYAIAHVPREHHGELFARVAGWLRPGGRFLASLGTGGAADWTGEWLGVPMFFSSHDPVTNRQLL